MTRILPGVYVTLNDYSTLPEGENNLTVGYVLQANRGPVGRCELVTSPTDFLAKYTFSGAPKASDDKTFWSVLQVLRQTNQVYIARACKNAKFGGLVVKKDTEVGTVSATTKATSSNGGTITMASAPSVQADDIVRVFGKTAINGRYKVTSVSGSTITLAKAVDKDETYKAMPADYTAASGDSVKLYKVVAPEALTTGLADEEAVEGKAEALTATDLFLITGADQGAYNNDIAISIISDAETPNLLTEDNIFTISVYDATTGGLLENPWTCSLNPEGKAFDGTTTYLNTVLESSAYIRGYVNANSSVTIDPATLPANCTKVQLGAGSDGDTLTVEDISGDNSPLELFRDKTIPVSILGNGTGELYEDPAYQKVMVDIADTRGDCVAFLNSRLEDEKATFNSTKASNIVTYKKSSIGLTNWCATMYAPHVNYADAFNSRTIKLGADSTAIAGWLNTIANQGYPYAYAGPTYGLVSGVTTNWKIGDTSGEAEVLNDASVNYVAYDAKVGRYYMQCQNTLQIANSALRNLGAVLNVLDMKETFAVYFKEYLQRPITDSLRSEMLLRGQDQMDLYLSQGRVTSYTFADASTDTDIANNTLRFVLTVALTSYAQNIILVMNIVNQSFDFSILQG